MAAERDNDDVRGARRPGRWKVAEWVTFVTCLLLVAGVASFLAYEATREHSPFVPVGLKPLIDRVHTRDARYYLPVEVTNQGRRTLQRLKVAVTYRSPDGRKESRDFEIDYLGERETQKVYVAFEDDPRGLAELKAIPLVYRLDE